MASKREEPGTAKKPTVSASSHPRTLYLTAYNILFASLWASVFFKAISNARNSKTQLFNATEPHARWIQTASLIEVLHAAFGTFISPPSLCDPSH
jgi:very-long-chain (3R)-3-hydroxyacyl-CoA dehydratase